MAYEFIYGQVLSLFPLFFSLFATLYNQAIFYQYSYMPILSTYLHIVSHLHFIMLSHLLILFYLQLRVLSLQVAPTWTTSSLVQAAEKNIISTISNENTSPIPSATMTFSFAFLSIPRLAYGISSYEGDDQWGQQYFEVYRASLTASSFRVKVQITGITNVWLLAVRYIVIDSAFPHHLNSFDNVPVNYSKGGLGNISVQRSTQTFYTNYINYTSQCASNGYTFRTFVAPYSNYKIVMYITSLFLTGIRETSSNPTLRPLNLRINTNIESSSIYMLNVSVKIEVIITRLHFSLIIYDKADVEASHKYVLVLQQVNYTNSGGITPIPKQFQTNLMMGFAEYSSTKTGSCLHFNLKLQFATYPSMSIYMPASVPRNKDVPFSRFCFNIFYIKTWICPNNTFFDVNTDLCVSCPILNCIECTYIDLCKTCNSTGGFLLDATAVPDRQCSLCPVPHCVNCTNATYCNQCDALTNYFIDPLNPGQCTLCSIPNCLSCINLTTCSSCDEPNDYFLNLAATESSDQCVLCIIPNCIDCQNVNVCFLCNQTNNYFVNPTSTSAQDTCILCSIPNCVSCLSLTQCSVCNEANGYFVNSNDKQCMLCPIPHCLICGNDSNCLECDYFTNYFSSNSTNSTQLCILCDIIHCYLCANLQECAVCQEFDNYFLNPSRTTPSDQCIQCNIPQCIMCSSLTTCTTCNASNQFFINPNATTALDQCLPCSIPFCAECASLADCLFCDRNLSHFYNPNFTSISDMCLPCTLSECVECFNLFECSVCNQSNSYFLNTSDLLCYICNISNCLECNTLTTCLICDTSNLFFLVPATGQCMTAPPICGDNIFLPPEACDDGNLDNNDGCSSLCTVETDFVCEPNIFPGFFNSICYFVGEITLRVVYIEKVDTANQIEIFLEFGPNNLVFWDFVDFAMMVSLSNMTGFDSYSVQRNSDGTVSIIANYNTNIHNMEITVNVEPAQSGQAALSRTFPAQRTFSVIPTDNEAALFYEQSVYDMAKIVSILAYMVAAFSLLLFLLGIFARKLIGLEMVAVVQISYLSLLALSSMTPCFRALTNIWFVNGFSYFFLSKGHLLDPHTPLPVKGIFLYSRLLENYNITFLLIIIPYLVSLICLVLAKTAFKSQKKHSWQLIRVARICACETTFNGVMFSGYIVAVASALQVQYGIKNMEGVIGIGSVVETCMMVLVFAIYFFLLIKVPQYFGEFVSSLLEVHANRNIEPLKCDSPESHPHNNSLVEDEQKNANSLKETASKQHSEPVRTTRTSSLSSKVKMKWYNFLIVERLAVGIGLVLMLPLEIFLTYFLISIFAAQLLVVVFWRPYFRIMHNLRFAMNMLICIAVQIILVLQKNQLQIAISSFIHSILPLVICVLLLICILYNVVLLLSQLYSKFQQKQQNSYEKRQQQQIFRELGQNSLGNRSLLSRVVNFNSSKANQVSQINNGKISQLRNLRKKLKSQFSEKTKVDRISTRKQQTWDEVALQYNQI